MRRRLKEAGREDLLRHMIAVVPFLKGERELTESELNKVIPNLQTVTSELERFLDEARQDTTVLPPVWSVPGIDGLERTVNEYAERVKTMAGKHARPATANSP